jgi:hypothetical protein
MCTIWEIPKGTLRAISATCSASRLTAPFAGGREERPLRAYRVGL